MPNTANSIPPDQVAKAGTLLALTWHFSGKPPGNLTIGHYNTLAKCIEEEIECTISGKSIKNFVESLGTGSLRGFKQNTTKETLAGYLMFKMGKTEEVEVLKGKGENFFNHPVRKYWIWFEEHYEELKGHLPAQSLAFPSEVKLREGENYLLRPVLSYYEGTSWLLFSRARKTGIYRLFLEIAKEKTGRFNKVYLKNASSQVEDYEGEVGMDAGQQFLIFNLVTCESRHKNLHLKIKVGRGTMPALAMGQSNFISSFSDQIMSDAVVLMRAPEGLTRETAARRFSPDSQDFLELPLCLRRYFHKKYKCRLTAPRPDIINIYQLEEWLEAQRAHKEPSRVDKVLAWYCDEYAVLYRTPDSEWEERLIRIFTERAVEEIHASIAIGFQNEFRNANVYRRGKSISLFYEETAGRETLTCYLTFQIPLKDFGRSKPSFEGYVSGFWPGLNGGFSPAVVFPKNLPGVWEK